METQGCFLLDNSGAAMTDVWIHHVAWFADLGYVTFFISVGAWASLPHFFAAFIPFVSLGMGRCAEEDGSLPFAFGSLCAHLAAFRFEMKSKDERRAASAHRPIPRKMA